MTLHVDFDPDDPLDGFMMGLAAAGGQEITGRRWCDACGWAETATFGEDYDTAEAWGQAGVSGVCPSCGNAVRSAIGGEFGG